MNLEEEVRQAGKAREILDNGLFKDAVRAIEEAIKMARLNSPTNAMELREKLWAQELALHSILANLRSYIDTGELAIEEIKRRTVAEKLKEFLN